MIDDTLVQAGGDKWNPKYGYRIPQRSSPARSGYKLKYIENWGVKGIDKITGEGTITLLKLHGSINWYIDETRHEVVFKERPYTKQRGTAHFTIIPPEWNKDFRSYELFNNLWSEADKRLRKARHLIMIGYSLTDTDLHALSLFRIAIQDEQLKTIIIVNPDQQVRFKARQVLSNSISAETRIVVFDSFEEFNRVNLQKLLSI